MCARFTHPGENILFKGLAGLLPKAEKVIFGHVHSLPSLQNLLHLRLFDAFCVKFQSAQQAQNLFLPCTIILHALQKTRARTLHTLLVVTSGRIYRNHTICSSNAVPAGQQQSKCQSICQSTWATSNIALTLHTFGKVRAWTRLRMGFKHLQKFPATSALPSEPHLLTSPGLRMRASN